MRRKHIPQRTCIACRQIGNKRELIRIVRSPTGSVQVDQTGKKSGRGAYLCHLKSCWDKALKGKQLEHALKAAISPEDMDNLKRFAATLTGSEQENADVRAYFARLHPNDIHIGVSGQDHTSNAINHDEAPENNGSNRS